MSTKSKTPQVNPDSPVPPPQPTTALDGATAGNATALAGANATPTASQSIPAAETRETPSTDGTSALAEVAGSNVPLPVRPPIVLLPADQALSLISTQPSIAVMTLDQKFETLKQGLSMVGGVRKILVEVFESIVASVKTYAKNRHGMPTVEEAFRQRGMNYKTIDSQIRRERERRLEYAQFYAAIKAEASSDNIHGLDVSDEDLPPVGEKVVVEGGRKGVLLTQCVTDGGKSAEVYFEDDGETKIVKAGDLVALAVVVAKKQAERVAKMAAKNSPQAVTKESARIAAATAKEDAALKSSDFYMEQYFHLVATMKEAPENMTKEEFAQTVIDNGRVAYQAMNAEEAKLVRPAPPGFPSFRGTKGMTSLIAFLSADAIGRPSPLKTIFGDAVGDGKFCEKVETFAQRICDLFHEGKFVVTIADRKKNEATVETEPVVTLDASVVSTTKVGDKSEPTLHGYYYEFVKTGGSCPYVIKDAVNPLNTCKTKADAELKVAEYERKAVSAELTKGEAV